MKEQSHRQCIRVPTNPQPFQQRELTEANKLNLQGVRYHLETTLKN